jgi:hypothetical protein
MAGDGKTRVYVRFRDEHLEDLDSEWNLEVEWGGGATFNIYSNGRNVDVFTHYGDDKGNPPTFQQAWEIAEEVFTDARKELIAAVGEFLE